MHFATCALFPVSFYLTHSLKSGPISIPIPNISAFNQLVSTSSASDPSLSRAEKECVSVALEGHCRALIQVKGDGCGLFLCRLEAGDGLPGAGDNNGVKGLNKPEQTLTFEP